jgi:DNA-binding transcriptional MerR regulator
VAASPNTDRQTDSPTDPIACSICGGTAGDFAPSGRCLACEASVDIPTAEHTSLRQIGEVAHLLGLSLRTVRHYEDAGLVLPAARTAGGFRLYDDKALERLRLIMYMKPLGFSLEEMRVLIATNAGLERADLDQQERAGLEDQLVTFAARAAEKCNQLRHQLSIAEAFALTLSQKAASAAARAGARA